VAGINGVAELGGAPLLILDTGWVERARSVRAWSSSTVEEDEKGNGDERRADDTPLQLLPTSTPVDNPSPLDELVSITIDGYVGGIPRVVQLRSGQSDAFLCAV
jgi:hypothetical protein